MAEVFSFPEGRLYLWQAYTGVTASANATSGTAIAFAQDSTLAFAYGWSDFPNADGSYVRGYTEQHVSLSISHLFGDMATFKLANSRSALNARFEAYNSGMSASAQWTLYSGVVDTFNVVQSDNASFKASMTFHANIWSAVGQ
jgi:hypothetical protein